MSSLLRLKSYEKCDKKLARYKVNSIYSVIGYLREHSCFKNNANLFPNDIIYQIIEFYHIDNDYIQRLLTDDIPTTLDPQQSFMAKLKLCQHPLVLTDATYSNEIYKQAIDAKIVHFQHLNQTITLFNTQNVDIHQIEEIMTMISNHIFRPLPIPLPLKLERDVKDDLYPDNDEKNDGKPPWKEWNHLIWSYELLLRLVIMTNIDKKLMAKVMRKQNFVSKLIELLATPNAKEREYIKTILHRIYGRIMNLREDMRKFFGNYLLSVIYDEQYPELSVPDGKIVYRYGGVCDILEIYASIGHGLSLPVKREHIEFIWKVIIPLHSCKKYPLFAEHLRSVSSILTTKDFAIGRMILYGLLRHWPRFDCTKQVLFIKEMWEIVHKLMSDKGFVSDKNGMSSLLMVIDKFIECTKSTNYNVVECVLEIFDKNEFVEVVRLNEELIWSKLEPVLVELSNDRKFGMIAKRIKNGIPIALCIINKLC